MTLRELVAELVAIDPPAITVRFRRPLSASALRGARGELQRLLPNTEISVFDTPDAAPLTETA